MPNFRDIVVILFACLFLFVALIAIKSADEAITNKIHSCIQAGGRPIKIRDHEQVLCFAPQVIIDIPEK